MVRFSVTEESFYDSFEWFRGAVGVVPEQHFDKVDHLVLHDALKCFKSVVADNATDDCRWVVFESREKRRRGDCDFEIGRWVAAVSGCLHRRHSTGAGHASRKSECQRPIGLLFTKLVNTSVEKVFVGNLKQEAEI